MRKLIAITLGVALALVGTVALASRNSSGTYTVTASGTYPFVTGTTISSTTMTSIFSDLSTEMTDSLSRSGKGGMLAPLRCTDGSNTAPSMSFTNETGTGFYRIGANDVGLAIGGTKMLEQNAAGLTETGWVDIVGTTTFGSNTSGLVASDIKTGILPALQMDSEYVSSVYDFTTISGGTCSSMTITSANAKAGAACFTGVSTALEDGLLTRAEIVSNGSVVIKVCSFGGNIDPASRTYSAMCFNPR